ncbi:MAG: aminopeptidase P family protein [Geminicoccaceae bacterium]|nr:aminopeptidase P family protein [Geminicoccaceae bacterium]
MSADRRLDSAFSIMDGHGLDALALVPGVNFLRLIGRDFHQNERPLVVVITRSGKVASIVPHLEMASFATLNLDGDVFDWRDETGYEAAFEAAGKALGAVGKLGVEGQRMRVFDFLALQRHLDATAIVDAHAAISSLRLHKSESELATLREAIRISEAALEATLQQVRVGLTETGIEAILVRELFAHGAQGLAFNPIVAAGANSAQPHAHARPDYNIRPGDALLFDFGACYNGFNADITRTFFVGQASDEDRAFYETVLAANRKGRETAGPGTTASDLDDAVQNVLEASPYARFRRHKTGHGLGLDVHEAPQIMRGNPQVLEPGMVFTIEPGLYRLGETGVRIEDDVAITQDGCEVLTSFPRELRLVAC